MNTISDLIINLKEDFGSYIHKYLPTIIEISEKSYDNEMKIWCILICNDALIYCPMASIEYLDRIISTINLGMQYCSINPVVDVSNLVII